MRTGAPVPTLVAAAGLVLLAGCSSEPGPPAAAPEAAAPRAASPGPEAFAPPRGLEGVDMPIPDDNPLTPGRIGLGKQLFFDPRLSLNNDMSCETCHIPEQGWTDGRALAPKFDGSLNTRNSPTLYGAAFYPDLYWDGRAAGLEKQILAAWKGNMGADPAAIGRRLAAIPGYNSQFEAEFGGPPTGDRIVMALASFVRTLHAGDTPWDNHPQDEASLAGSEIGRGFKVFSETARCAVCHAPPLFSDLDFHNAGVGFDSQTPDMGRGKALRTAAENAGHEPPEEAETLLGAFKTPSLRGVALTGPYFHDGSVATLEAAIDFMLAGGRPNAHLDQKLKPAQLTDTQRLELIAFLRSLTPDTAYSRPTLP